MYSVRKTVRKNWVSRRGVEGERGGVALACFLLTMLGRGRATKQEPLGCGADLITHCSIYTHFCSSLNVLRTYLLIRIHVLMYTYLLIRIHVWMYQYVCVYIYMYVYIIYIYINTYICEYIHIHMCVCACVYTYTYTHAHIYTHTHTHLYICIYT